MPTDQQISDLENASEVGTLLEEMNRVLRDHGFDDLEVTTFSVAETSQNARAHHGAPCPIKCRRQPDGTIRCAPEC